jgi:hypothetical protein
MHVVVESGRPRPAEVTAGASAKRCAQQHNVKKAAREAISLQAAWHSALPLEVSV